MNNTSEKLLRIIGTGAVALILGVAQIASAQTTVTPGTPTTDLGGTVSSNIVVILFSLSLVVIGLILARKEKILQ